MSQDATGQTEDRLGKTVLITGGTGAIGPVLVRRLLDAGYDVRVLVWGPTPQGVIPQQVVQFEGNIVDRGAICLAVAGVDLVFHLAAKLHINNPAPGLRDEYWRINVEGTRCLAQAAADAGVRRLVHFSTINVYGPSQPPEVFDETSPMNCRSWYAETKCESERVALGLLPTTVLRMAAVYGPRMKGNYSRLLGALRSRRYVHVGPGCNRRTLVYQNDVAAAAVLAAEHPQANGQVYNVSDGTTHTLGEIVAELCAALGRRPPRIRIPLPAARACAAVVDRGMVCLKRQPFARPAVDKLIEDMAVDGGKIQRELGFVPEYDLPDGCRALAADLDR